MENEWPRSEAVKPQRRRREQTRLSAKDLRAGPGARGSADPALDLADEQPALTVRAGPCRAGFPLLSAPLLPRDGTLTSSRAPPSKRSLWTRAPKFGHRGKVAATTEPFPRRKQVSGGPGNPADKSPRRDRQRPVAAGGNRRRAPLAWAPKSRVRGARARPKVTFGRSQVSPPVFAATQPHCSSLRPRLSFAAWRAACCPHPRSRVADVRLADGAQPGTGPQTRPLRLPYAPYRSRSAGIPASGQTLLINRRMRRSRQPPGRPAFISARRGGPYAGSLPSRAPSPRPVTLPGRRAVRSRGAARGCCASRRGLRLPALPAGNRGGGCWQTGRKGPLALQGRRHPSPSIL